MGWINLQHIRMFRRGETGMSTLIVFIAMILVAAVAAGVLISTTGTLQNKALATGKATSQEVGTSVSAVEVFAENGSDQSLTYFYETIKLSAGSEAIRFSDVLISMSLDNTSADYAFNSNVSCSEVPVLSGTATNMTAGGDFGIQYQIQGTNYKDGYLNKGDVVRLCFQGPRDVIEGEDLKVTLIPQVGNPLVVETKTPQLMVDTRIPIYP